jgi:hypothetical protein
MQDSGTIIYYSQFPRAREGVSPKTVGNLGKRSEKVRQPSSRG